MIARAAVTAALVAAVAWQLDLRLVFARAVRLDAVWLAAAFVAVLAAIAVSTWKWGAILRLRKHPLPAGRLVRHYLVGLFFNNVLPTTIGGDAVRAWEATRDTREIPEAVGSVVSERLIAGAGLGITALVGLPFVGASPRLVLLLTGLLVLDFALLALFFVPKVAERTVFALLPRRFASVQGAAAATVTVVRESLRAPRLFGRVLAASIAFQILVAAVNASIFAAMGLPVGLGRCVVYTPIIFTVTMLPISLSGLGVREAAYWYFFSHEGVAQADAVAASLCFFVVVAIASLPGAALFALGRRESGIVRSEVANA